MKDKSVINWTKQRTYFLPKYINVCNVQVLCVSHYRQLLKYYCKFHTHFWRVVLIGLSICQSKKKKPSQKFQLSNILFLRGHFLQNYYYYWTNFQKIPSKGFSWRKSQTLTEFFISFAWKFFENWLSNNLLFCNKHSQLTSIPAHLCPFNSTDRQGCYEVSNSWYG